MAFEKSATLVPFSENAPDSLPAVWLTLELGEWAVLGPEFSLLKITPHRRTSSSYKVERLIGGPELPRLSDGIAEDWDASTTEKILRPDISRNTGILLVPSLIGPNLHGGDLPGGDRLRQLYGVIRLGFDQEEKKWGVQIVMPDTPKPGFESMDMYESTID